MACPIQSGITKACRDARGGLTTIYVTEWANMTQASITSASGILTNVATFLSTGKKFWTIEVEMGASNEVENIVTARAAGTTSYEPTLNFYIPKKQASVGQWVMTLAQNDLAFIIKDKNGKNRLLGQQFGLGMESSTAPSGTNMPDQNGYLLAFKGEETYLANEVSDALLAALLVAA